jgi:hypothetical protein
MFDLKLNRQFIFRCMRQRKHREQSMALSLHQALVTVTAAITHHKTGNKFYMVQSNGIELIASPNELESLA